jgi:hypothetical protein
MKRVSTNHPSLRGASCYDCGDDQQKQGWLDTIDSAFFCDRCHQDRHPSIKQRRQAVGRRHWDDYDQRVERSRRVIALSGITILGLAAFTSENNPNIMIPAFILALGCLAPYVRQELGK